MTDTILNIVVIAGVVVGLVYSVVMLYAIVKIWRILEEIINSGAIPRVLEQRCRKVAQDMLRAGYVDNPQMLEKIIQVLTESKDAQLVSELRKLLKRQQASS